MSLRDLRPFKDSGITGEPVAALPPNATLGDAQMVLNKGFKGLVVRNAGGRIITACSGDYLNTLAVKDKTLLSLLPEGNFQILDLDITLGDLLAVEIPGRVNYIVAAGKNGEPAGIIETWKLARWFLEQLLPAACRLEAVLDTVNEAITIIDDQHKVVGWNRRAEELYQIPSNDIYGKLITSFFTDLMVTRVMQDNREVTNVYHQPCSGTHVLINSRPIKCGEKIMGSISAERDITEIVHLHQDLSRANTQVKMLEKEISKITEKRDAFNRIMGHSLKLEETIGLARRVANTNATVLIRGESGTGKELFAEAIHLESDRRDKPFVVINCGAIPVTLFESELFGYQAGAFTGADRKGKPGKFELADGGTLFLDEIGELQPEMQVKLLRVLQKKVFYRVGGSEPVQVDVRIIAATHRNLESMIHRGMFREDLYYRLNVVSLEIPPLCERKEDIPELVYTFIHEFARSHNRTIKQVSPEAMSVLLNYAWPGNVRELRNVVERLVILTEAEVINLANMPQNLKPLLAAYSSRQATTLGEITKRSERDIITKALDEANGNKALAARRLGIPRSTLYYKMKSLGID